MPFNPALRNMTGKTIAGYHLTQIIGYGSYGATYKAISGSETICLKVSDKFRGYENEWKTMEKLKGIRGVPTLIMHNSNETLWVIGMSLEGPNLKTLQERNPTKSFQKSTLHKMLYQLVTILEEIHTRGIVHRDIKLNNIIVSHPRSNDNSVYLIICDYGQARQYRNEEGQRIMEPDDDYRLANRFHATPNVDMGEDHGPMDDVRQLSYAVLFASGYNDPEYLKNRTHRDKIKRELFRAPTGVLPECAQWMEYFFEAISENDDIDFPNYEEIKDSILEVLPVTNAIEPLRLSLEADTWYLF
ncbi:hypothetical protein GCK72_022057 [Caenorhabditis remanei]|uniref:non-specific serine/threonine protein kinase n=1 Tax=Caenorhabditis remanei TaxID=31234 RepID=A0A6A5FSQ3_CAERE|nr:hypothetical protein GCK72_022057 [Caenorhabditis remanei]KAF1745610.1 hypothetical protein GCK72_022057 [Caenorhabditis remanei]